MSSPSAFYPYFVRRGLIAPRADENNPAGEMQKGVPLFLHSLAFPMHAGPPSGPCERFPRLTRIPALALCSGARGRGERVRIEGMGRIEKSENV